MADPTKKTSPKKISFLINKMEFVVPEFSSIDEFLYGYYGNIFEKRGKVIVKQGRKILTEIEVKDGRSKAQAWEDFRREFFEDGSDGQTILEPNMKLIFREYKQVKPKKIKPFELRSCRFCGEKKIDKKHKIICEECKNTFYKF